MAALSKFSVCAGAFAVIMLIITPARMNFMTAFSVTINSYGFAPG